MFKLLSSAITKIVDKKSAIPVVGGVLVDAEKRQLTMTDLDISLVMHDAPVFGKGSIVVDAYALRGIAADTKKDFKMLIVEDGLEINSDGDVYTIPMLAKAEDFPIMVDKDVDVTATIKKVPVSIFDVLFAASTEETRYYLGGVFLHTRDKKLIAVAADGHRLTTRSVNAFVTGRPLTHAKQPHVIIPRKTVKVIRGIFSSDEINIEVIEVRGDERIRIDMEGMTFVSRIIDGTFPEYTRTIPSGEATSAHSIPLEVAEVRSLMKKAKTIDAEDVIFFGDKQGWHAKLNGKRASLDRLIHPSSDMSAADRALEVKFNMRYVSDIVENIALSNDVAPVTLRVGDPHSPTRLSGHDVSVEYILMPMRIY